MFGTAGKLFRFATGVVWQFAGPCLALVVLVDVGGCSRSQYRQHADEDALTILDEKSQDPQWTPPLSYSIEPSPQSRLFDPSPIEDPILPDARPRLHAYEIPSGIGRRTTTSADESPLAKADWTNRVQPASFSSAKSSTSKILLTRYAVQDDLTPHTDEFVIEPVTIPPSAWESIPVR